MVFEGSLLPIRGNKTKFFTLDKSLSQSEVDPDYLSIPAPFPFSTLFHQLSAAHLLYRHF